MNLAKLLPIIAILITQVTYGQLPITFKPSRYVLNDTTKYNKLNTLIKNKEFEKLEKQALSYADSCFEHNNTEEFLFVLNQAAANINILGKNIDKALEIMHYAEKQAKIKADTMNAEFIILMKYIATSYFYKYEDHKAFNYYYRGYNLTHSLKNDSVLHLDFMMNVGNTYVNLGNNQKALPYIDSALRISIKRKIPLVFMLTSQAYGYIASQNDAYLAIDFYSNIEKVAENLQTEDHHFYKFLANICNALAALYHKTDNNEKAGLYERKALNYIRNTSINDIYLNLSIIEKNLETRIDNNDRAGINRIKDSLYTYIATNNLSKNPVIIPSFSSLLYYYSKNNIYDSAKYIKQNIDSIVLQSKVRPDIKAYYYMVQAKSLKNKKNAVEQIYNSNKALLGSLSLSNPDSCEAIYNIVSESDFLKIYLYNINYLADYNMDLFINTNNKSFLDSAINNLNLLLNCIPLYASGTVEKNMGLYYSNEMENTGNKLINCYYTKYTQFNDKESIDNIVLLDSKIKAFYLQKQKQSIENKNNLGYLNLLMQKNYYENELQEAHLNNNLNKINNYTDSVLDVSFKIVANQIKSNIESNNNTVKTKNFNYQDNLSANEGIISYYINDTLLYIVTITKQSTTVKQISLPNNFKELITQIKRNIKVGNAIPTETNQTIHNILLKHSNILPEHKYLTIVPHKYLYEIPFEVLKDESGALFISKHSISYHISTGMIQKTKNKGTIEKIALFAPLFNEKDKHISERDLFSQSFIKIYKRNRQEINGLPYSKEELVNIASIAEKNNVTASCFFKDAASEQSLRNELKKNDIVHIATHGYVNNKFNKLSGLFFWPQSMDDGFLFTGEILNLEIKSDLVVLSSCNSGKGKIENSEGVNSLQRNFIQINTPNVIASLWKVHDEKTKDLMVAFYKHLLEDKVSYAEALRLAKLDCIEKGFLPVDWAGFVLIGN